LNRLLDESPAEVGAGGRMLAVDHSMKRIGRDLTVQAEALGRVRDDLRGFYRIPASS
jgi:hypothetical protein